MKIMHLDPIGVWTIAALLTGLVVGPTVYSLKNTEVKVDDFSAPVEYKPLVSEAGEEAKQEVTEIQSGEFGYEGTNGPESWAKLDPENYACSTGSEQSPINLTAEDALVTTGTMKTQYRPFLVRSFKTSNRVVSDYQVGSFVNGDDVEYFAQAIDYHIPSEHAVSGKHFDLEMQIEHKAENGRLSRVSLLFKKGKFNEEFEKLIKSMPDDLNRAQDKVNFNVAKILPRKLDYYHYLGSMTIPPCSEGVSWYVLQTTAEISSEQLDKMNRLLRYNARPIQNRGDRKITMNSN